MRRKKTALTVNAGWARNAGALAVSWRGFSLHFVVQRDCWVWGYDEDYYDGPLPSFGVGPVFLLCWMYSLRESYQWGLEP